MTFVLQRQPLTSLDILEKQTAEEARRTLGYFLSELRKRASLEEEFDENLRQFLELRNQFAHRLHSVEGLNFNTAEGIAVAEAYIGRVAGLAEYVLKVFTGLVRAWQEEVGLQVSFPQDEYFQEIDRIYNPAADWLFSAKAPR
jgi:hypothetical protein